MSQVNVDPRMNKEDKWHCGNCYFMECRDILCAGEMGFTGFCKVTNKKVYCCTESHTRDKDCIGENKIQEEVNVLV